MTRINLIVNGSKVRAEVDSILTSGSIGIPVTIQYDSSWDGLTKHLVCTSGKWGPTGKPRAMLNVDAASTVPQEVMIAENHLYLGIEGRSKDGSVAVPTIWADCGMIFPGANANADLTVQPTLPVWGQMQAQLNKMQDDLNYSLAHAGLNAAQVNALDELFKVCAFSADAAAAYTAFKTAFSISASNENGGGTGNNDDDDGTNKDDQITYAVINHLTNVTNSNSDATASGFYSATLTAVDGFNMQSVLITMGGVDITEAVYGDGGILITDLTGDIVITAVASVALAYALTEPLTFTGSGNAVYDTGYAMYPNGTKDVSVCIDFDHTASPWSNITLATANVDYGYKLHHSGNQKWRMTSNAGDATTELTVPLTNCRMVYTQGQNAGFALYALVDDTVTKFTGSTYAYYPDASENTVILGTYSTSFKGRINDFRVYDQILSDGQIEAYLRGGTI